MHAFKKSKLQVESLLNHDSPPELRNVHKGFKIIHVCKKSQVQVQSLINDESSSASLDVRSIQSLTLPKLIQSISVPKDERSLSQSAVKKIDYHSKKNHLVRLGIVIKV